jgi:hypothetical protein
MGRSRRQHKRRAPCITKDGREWDRFRGIKQAGKGAPGWKTETGAYDGRIAAFDTSSLSGVGNADFPSRAAYAHEYHYRPTSDVYDAAPGSIEHWLTERDCLYGLAPDGSLWRNEVHHFPWPLQSAEAEIGSNAMFGFHGLTVGGPPALLHFLKRLEVVIWKCERVQ